MPPNFPRLVYAGEFLLALVAVLMLWSQAGGQGHLDLMPWYAKLILSLLMSFTVVGGTMAAVKGSRTWNGRTLAWLAAGLLLAAGMTALTYYYHLHEEEADHEEGDSVALVAGVGAARLAP